MYTDKEGRALEVYDDNVSADTVEEGDQVYLFAQNDPIEVEQKIDSGDSIMLKGYSHITGDSVTYVLTPYERVGLWTA